MIPRVFYYIIKFVVPVYLVVLFCGWLWQDISSETSVILVRGIDPQHIIYQWISRLTMIGVILAVAFLVKIAWRKIK